MERLSDYNLSDAVVSKVDAQSIAEELGIVPGDRLLAIDGIPVRDVFDFRLRETAECLTLLFDTVAEGPVEIEIEKDEDEPLGLDFENPLLDRCESCSNRCVFCFIDQLPPGMRESLYFKDDDTRLSFLTGNYITLTNLTDEELKRLISYHLSPLNISVHATNPSVRRRLMGNKKAGELMDHLREIVAAGIQINCQFVLCPGLNDGEVLEESLETLATLGDGLRSIAVVPVGITKWRQTNRLYPLKPYTPDQACRVVEQIHRWQGYFLKEKGTRLVYASDEFYIKGNCPLPDSDFYEGFPQLENGVGMASLFLQEIHQAAGETAHIPEREKPVSKENPVVHIPTGKLIAPLMESVSRQLGEVTQTQVRVHGIENIRFGPEITVTGLLTGQDIANQLKSMIQPGEHLLICDTMLRNREDVFLDDWTMDQLSKTIGCPVHKTPEGGKDLVMALKQIGKDVGLAS